jgi:hypothetical protein
VTETATRTDRPVAGPRSRSQNALRVVGVIAGTTLAMLAADYLASYAVVLALFGNVVMLVVIPIAAVGLTAVIVGLSKALTGRLHIPGATAVTVLLAGVGAYGFLNGILDPLPLQTDIPLHLGICALAAVAFGLFLGPWPLRIIGALAAVAVIALISSQPTARDVAQEQYEQTQADYREENLEYFRASGVIPLVTDLDGWSNPLVRATGGDAMTWMKSDAGAVADVLVTGHVDAATLDARFPCTWIHREGDSNTETPDGMYDWCVRTAAGWERPDGTGIAFIRDGTLVTLNAGDDFDIRDTDGQRPATPEEVAALFGSLRPMTTAEVEKNILPAYDGVDTPVIETPGL